MQRKNKLLDIARQMPPLRHSIQDERFDITKSEAVKWLVQQPDILSYVWDHVKQSGAIDYNAESGKWIGVDVVDVDD